MKTIGIFGAAFDPLHLGHLAIGRLALSLGVVDEVWLMPSPDRWDKKPAAPDTQRLQWAQMAALSERRHGWAVSASDFELLLGEFRGTYRLLTALREHNSSNSYKLLLGQDSLNSLPSWRDAATQTLTGMKLVEEFSLVVAPRGDQSATLPTWARPHASRIEFLPPFVSQQGILNDLGPAAELARLSSTDIRRRLRQGENIHYSLPEIEHAVSALALYKD